MAAESLGARSVDGLSDLAYHAVIVMDEPMLKDFDSESKVDAYFAPQTRSSPSRRLIRASPADPVTAPKMAASLDLADELKKLTQLSRGRGAVLPSVIGRR
ncbi:MAG: hypothetical protein M3256_03135 [Actinomycetota bacterium]|nr:hypothetical protein [Actinomycetota bacterium]